MHHGPVLGSVARIGHRVPLARLLPPAPEGAMRAAVDHPGPEDERAHAELDQVEGHVLVGGAPLHQLQRLECGILVHQPTLLVTMDPHPAGVDQLPQAAVLHRPGGRFEGALVVGGRLAPRIERSVHHRVAVLEVRDEALGPGQVADDRLDAERLEGARPVLAAGQAQHLVPRAEQACGNGATDVARRSGHEHSLVHGSPASRPMSSGNGQAPRCVRAPFPVPVGYDCRDRVSTFVEWSNLRRSSRVIRPGRCSAPYRFP